MRTKRETLWAKYGLSILHHGRMLTKPELEGAIRGHDLVAAYMETHPEVAEKYEVDQTGEVKYFDVLDLAEKEERCLERSGRDQT